MITNKHEKGSLMIEILAVLALISLITPMLFKQVSRRNEEVLRMNIATEMRSIKDALSAYIQVYEEQIATEMSLYDATGGYYVDPAGPYTIKLTKDNNHLGALTSGFLLGNAATGALLSDYELFFIGRTVPLYTGAAPLSGEKNRPLIIGLVLQKNGSEKLSDASRIASLIGSEGGVRNANSNDSDYITGIGQAWKMAVPDGASNVPSNEYAVAAVTSFDADTNSGVLHNLRLEHFIGNTSQADYMAAGRLSAQEYLSVGPKNGDSCIKGYGTTGMVINGSDEGSDAERCNPLFEVNGTTGEVRMRGAIVSDVSIPVNMTREPLGITCSDDTVCPAGSRCVNSECVYEKYSVDPAYTSVMNDIKLTSRGGARLSEILPNYIAKSIRTVASGTEVPAPECPEGYVQAITVQPTTVEQGKTHATTVSFKDGDGATVRASYVDPRDEDNLLVIKVEPDVGSATENGYNKGTHDKISNWLVTASIKTLNDTSGRTPIQTTLLVHTYCVYDADYFADKLPDSKHRPGESLAE